MAPASIMRPLLFAIFIALVLQCEACSRRRKTHHHMDRLHHSPGQCGCVPLRTCPSIERALRAARPLSEAQLAALKRATCDPLGDPQNPDVKCCDKYVDEIEQSLNAIDDTVTKNTPAPGPTPGPTQAAWQDFENECGRCDPALDPRIIGGSEARIGQFPWIARLGYVEDDSEMKIKDASFLCGGSLIGRHHILTAGHCVDRSKHLSQLKWVRLGEHDERTDPDCSEMDGCAPPTQDMEVEWAVAHPNYRSNSFRNDIGMIKLKHPVNFTNWVHPVCLPTHSRNANLTGVRAVLAGWGTDQPGTTGSVPVLKFLWKRFVEMEECVAKYRGVTSLNEGQLCAGGRKGEDSCNGDSGGPLARPEADDDDEGGGGHYTLVGVVSFGPRLCGSGGLPGVYAKVTAYMDWIRAVTRPGWSPKASSVASGAARTTARAWN